MADWAAHNLLQSTWGKIPHLRISHPADIASSIYPPCTISPDKNVDVEINKISAHVVCIMKKLLAFQLVNHINLSEMQFK